MRTLPESMGHRDQQTTLRYADYAPSAHEAAFVEAAFSRPAVAASPDEVAHVLKSVVASGCAGFGRERGLREYGAALGGAVYAGECDEAASVTLALLGSGFGGGGGTVVVVLVVGMALRMFMRSRRGGRGGRGGWGGSGRF